MDMEQARFNMVEQQIRPWDVLDQDVLDLLLRCGARISCRKHTASWPLSTWKFRSATVRRC